MPRPAHESLWAHLTICPSRNWIKSCEAGVFGVSESTGDEQVVKRVERVLEEGLERVETPEAARAVVARIEQMSAGHTEAELGEAAAHQTATATDAAAHGSAERARCADLPGNQ